MDKLGKVKKVTRLSELDRRILMTNGIKHLNTEINLPVQQTSSNTDAVKIV